MRVNFRVTNTWLLVFSLVFLIVTEARAEIQLTENFSVAGLLRQELAVHTGEKNPYLTASTERNTINLSRTFFHTEWTYKPNSNFQIFSKVKLLSDQTFSMDSRLNQNYNAFPHAGAQYGSELRGSDDSSFNAEMSELYADVNVGNLWVRLGKQQIVWGEMIGGRILDQANPLDLSWHWTLEPEEFENIRIPQWAMRARYNVPQQLMPLGVGDVYLEGFLNPGDIAGNRNAQAGSPVKLSPSPIPAVIAERRDEIEFGLRLGMKVGQVAGTLNYLSLYSDTFYTNGAAGAMYPKTDMFGISLNYALPEPYNTTITYEGIVSPDEPYYDRYAAPGPPQIRTATTVKHAIAFAKSAFILPRPNDAMSIQLQYSGTQIWNHDLLKLTGGPYSNSNKSELNNNPDGGFHAVALIVSQSLFHKQLDLSCKVIYTFDDNHLIQPGIKYRNGDHWIYDLYLVKIGGPDGRPGRFGSLSYLNEVFGRVTYQF